VTDPAELLDFALHMADEADAITLPAFLDGVAAHAKADGTPVTDADTAVERAIRQRIGATFPGHGILGEELGAEPAQDGTRWIIDPIDGTVNFTRRIAVWATLIAAEHDGELVAAVVSSPALAQRWSAARGAGATTVDHGRERSIHVSHVHRLAEAHVVHAGLGAMQREGIGPGLYRVLEESKRDRGFGDALGYMLVAQGSADVMIETLVKPWDLAAPAMIVTEAGGRFSDLSGKPGFGGPTALATNGHLHEEVLRTLDAG
jgi:histidinol-phosphatase